MRRAANRARTRHGDRRGLTGPPRNQTNQTRVSVWFVCLDNAHVRIRNVTPRLFAFWSKCARYRTYRNRTTILVDADREYEAGDILQASEKLWGAATHAVVAEMQRREIEANGHRKIKDFVKNLGVEIDDPLLFPLFKHGETLHVNFYHGFL